MNIHPKPAPTVAASLAMYDRDQTRDAHDRFWAAIRDGLRDKGHAAPEDLTRGEQAFWPTWTAPGLLLSQTCGYPYRARLHRQVSLVGTPDYGLPDCPPGFYRSVFVARRNDPRASPADFSGARFAFNEPMSQSGWAAPQSFATARGLQFPPTLCTGAHWLSAMAVVEGRADLAALDAMSWSMMVRWDGFAQDLKVVGFTDLTPGLPLITGQAELVDTLFAVISAAIAGLSNRDRDLLSLRGLIKIDQAAYLAVPTPPSPDKCEAALRLT